MTVRPTPPSWYWWCTIRQPHEKSTSCVRIVAPSRSSHRSPPLRRRHGVAPSSKVLEVFMLVPSYDDQTARRSPAVRCPGEKSSTRKRGLSACWLGFRRRNAFDRNIAVRSDPVVEVDLS